MRAKYLPVNLCRLQFVLVWLLCAANAANAEQTLLPWLTPYAGGQSIRFSETQSSDYVLALGKFKTIDAIWRLDAEQRLTGQLQRETWRIPKGHSVEQALEAIDAQFLEHEAATLYACDGRECGSSNQWANLVFQERQLYGLEQRQFYRAYKLAGPNGAVYAALYVVQRGNKRVYAHVDLLAETGATAAANSLLSRLETRGKLRLLEPVDATGAVTADVAERLQQLAGELLGRNGEEGQKKTPKLWVVGHSYAVSGVESNQDEALALAEAVKAALEEAGIAAQYLSTYSLGPLARLGGKHRGKARVEILLAE